jgi:hypothetical protein
LNQIAQLVSAAVNLLWWSQVTQLERAQGVTALVIFIGIFLAIVGVVYHQSVLDWMGEASQSLADWTAQ